MAEVNGLHIRMLASKRPDEATIDRLATMRTMAIDSHRRIHRYIESMCSAALCLQDSEYLDRLMVVDDPWGTTGPAVASSLIPMRNPHVEALRRHQAEMHGE